MCQDVVQPDTFGNVMLQLQSLEGGKFKQSCQPSLTERTTIIRPCSHALTQHPYMSLKRMHYLAANLKPALKTFQTHTKKCKFEILCDRWWDSTTTRDWA